MTPYRTPVLEMRVPERLRKALLADEEVVAVSRQSAAGTIGWSAAYALILVAALVVPLPGLRPRTPLERLPSTMVFPLLWAMFLWRRPRLAVVTNRRLIMVRRWPLFITSIPVETIHSVSAQRARFYIGLRIETMDGNGGREYWLMAQSFTPSDPAGFCSSIESARAVRRRELLPPTT